MKRQRALEAFLIVATAHLFVTCASATTGPGGETAGPTIDQLGRTMVGFYSPLVEVVVDYKFADTSVGDDWLILNVAVTSSESEAIEIRSNKVQVRTPDGRTIPLPSYSDFIAAYPELQSAARRAALASDPVDFTHGGRKTCDLGFQPLPGTTSALESVYVNMRKICQGLLFFPIENGIQPGRWQFIIEFEEFDAQVPFVIGDSH